MQANVIEKYEGYHVETTYTLSFVYQLINWLKQTYFNMKEESPTVESGRLVLPQLSQPSRLSRGKEDRERL